MSIALSRRKAFKMKFCFLRVLVTGRAVLAGTGKGRFKNSRKKLIETTIFLSGTTKMPLSVVPN